VRQYASSQERHFHGTKNVRKEGGGRSIQDTRGDSEREDSQVGNESWGPENWTEGISVWEGGEGGRGNWTGWKEKGENVWRLLAWGKGWLKMLLSDYGGVLVGAM